MLWRGYFSFSSSHPCTARLKDDRLGISGSQVRLGELRASTEVLFAFCELLKKINRRRDFNGSFRNCEAFANFRSLEIARFAECFHVNRYRPERPIIHAD